MTTATKKKMKTEHRKRRAPFERIGMEVPRSVRLMVVEEEKTHEQSEA